MEKTAPLIKVQAEKRSKELGGGQLPRHLPSQLLGSAAMIYNDGFAFDFLRPRLKSHLPLVAWEQPLSSNWVVAKCWKLTPTGSVTPSMERLRRKRLRAEEFITQLATCLQEDRLENSLCFCPSAISPA